MFRRASRTTDELHLSWYHSQTLYQQILKYQRIYLASHVLYGSSRLGTKDYLPGQIYSLVDYQQAQPVIDTAVLNSRRPWYSGKYNDNIQANATTAWGHTQTDPFGSSERIGEKQYELSNHLGNVQATVSDNPYLVAEETTDTILATHPALRSAYDYYPFGMLMPGRYVSDTSEHCVTISRPTWAWKEVTVACWDVYFWQWPGYTRTGEGTAVVDGDAVKINAPNATDAVSFDFPVTPNVQQELNLDIKQVSLNDKASVQIMEQQGENWVTLAESPVDVVSGGLTIPFKPSGSQIKVVWHGRILVWVRKDCISKLEWVEEDQLVTICDGDKDKYRFGFNDKEKINEWAGIGNYLDFGARGLDSRTGRWQTPDPKEGKYPNISTYAFVANNPSVFIDPDGKEIIDSKGNVAVKLENGKVVFTDFATKDIKKAINSLAINRVGEKTIKMLVEDPTKVEIEINNKDIFHSTDEFLASKNGMSIPQERDDKNSNLLLGATEVIKAKDNKLVRTKVTLFTKAIDKAIELKRSQKFDDMKVYYEYYTSDEVLGATMAHEGIHGIDEESNSKLGVKTPEKKPEKNEEAFYKEIDKKENKDGNESIDPKN